MGDTFSRILFTCDSLEAQAESMELGDLIFNAVRRISESERRIQDANQG